MRALITLSLAVTVCTAAGLMPMISLAADAVVLPKTAKLLTKAEAIVVYGGNTTTWSHPNSDKVTGTAVFDATVTSASGEFQDGKNKGEWESKITWKGDQYCWQARAKGIGKFGKPVCNLIYQDAKTVYEVDPKSKKVTSVDLLQ
jgi:hypothetical protein